MPTNQTYICGGCLCGAVRYEAAGSPREVSHCHCADCRRASAAAFVTWASLAPADFRFTAGEAATVEWAGRLRTFCARCGTPLTFAAGACADELDVTVCSFDRPEEAIPQNHIWVEDRLPWVHLADGLQTYGQARPNQVPDPGEALAANTPSSPESGTNPAAGASQTAPPASLLASISITPFAAEQIGALVALLEAQLREHDVSTSPDVLRSVLHTLAEQPQHGFLLVAASGAFLVGFAYASRVLSMEHGGWSGWLEELYVRPDWRGRGVGSRLLAAVVAGASERGWPAMDLETGVGHERAASLYERHQFQAAHRTRYVRRL